MLNPLSLITSSPYALAIKAGAVLIAVGLVFYGGVRFGQRLDNGVIAQMQAADAKAQTRAVTIALDIQSKQNKTAIDAAVSEATAQQKIVTVTQTIKQEVPVYVTKAQDVRTCITIGLARVMRGAAEGADPSTLQLAPGQSDDACSDVTATEMAGWFADYAAAARGNAEQLNDLEATVTKLIADYNSAGITTP